MTKDDAFNLEKVNINRGGHHGGKESKSVGYGKPPKNTRFRKGRSGNPTGRPKGSLNVATVAKRAVLEKVTIQEHGRRKQITKLEAALKQTANKAANGDLKSLQLLLPVISSAEQEEKRNLPVEILVTYEDPKRYLK